MVRKVIPVEQGLRLLQFSQILFRHHVVRKVIPVEQGLRHYITMTISTDAFVRKVIPVEQGLRHIYLQYVK